MTGWRFFAAAAAVLAVGSLTFAGHLGGPAQAQQTAAERRIMEREVGRLLDGLVLAELRRSPEWTDRLGLSPRLVPGLPMGDALDDRSPAAYDRARLEWIEALAQIEALPPAARKLPGVEVAEFAYGSLVEISAFGYGRVDLSTARPYAMDHMQGAYIQLVDAFAHDEPVRTAADAERWLARIAAAPRAIDADLRRFDFDARRGVVPPHEVLWRMRDTALALSMGDPAAHPMVVAFAAQLEAADGLTAADRQDLVARAMALTQAELMPAYARVVARVDLALSRPSSGPGVWAFPEGPAYYDALLGYYTASDMNAEDVQQLGMEEVTRIDAELDAALRAIGLEEGSVGERLAALGAMKGQIYSDDEEGRRAIMERMRGLLEGARALMPEIFPSDAVTPVAVVAVPEYMQGAAPSAYYTPGAIDGARPALLVLNLADMNDWPDFTLATLIYHETLPGHHADAAYPRGGRNTPMISRLVWVPAYTEGWATYAEDLADELGAYEGDPMSRIGYLQSMQLRAVRLVVDTGLHARRWSREEAVSYLVARTGLPRPMMEAEVDRYIVWPGQAVTYSVGRDFIRRERELSRQVLGDDFDLREFHDVILKAGPRPLAAISRDLDAWRGERARASMGAR